MLEDIKNKKIDVIVIKDLSRLGRNYIETGNFIEVIFPAMGVSVISVDENCEIDSSDYYGDDYLPLKNLFNDMYAKDLSRKVKLAKRQRAMKGYYMSGQPPFGYKPDPNNKNRLIIDEEAAIIVRKIFKLRFSLSKTIDGRMIF